MQIQTFVCFYGDANMSKEITNELLNIQSKLLLINGTEELLRLSTEFNSSILRVMELEKTGVITPAKNGKKTSSAKIKFTKKEIESMSKTFKKEFIANGLVSHVIKRPSGKKGFYYEIRYRRNGYNITVSNRDIEKAKELFIEATKKLESPEILAKTKLKFGAIANEWLKYKNGKIDQHTWRGYEYKIQKYFSTPQWNDRPITQIRTSDIDNFMRQFNDNPRGYEDMRTIFNQVFKYAIASGIMLNNPVTLVPFKRAERENREALTPKQIIEFLTRLQNPKYDKIRKGAYILYFFGLRPCEIDEEARFENGFLICRNRKRKSGKIEYKKIPIPKQAKGLINFDEPITYNFSYSCFARNLIKALGNGYTPYNLRHTFASICSETVKKEVVEVWMGDSSDRLVGKVYVHFSDEFMKAQMDTVQFPTI